jgi:hypothetical protein
MKRLLIVLLAVAGLAAGTMPALGATPPRTRLRSPICQRALDPGARTVGITSVMRPLSGTQRVALRFELQGLRPGGRYLTITGGDLGVWISPSNPTLGQRPGDVWIVNKVVRNLTAPAHYRFQVSFRWFGAHKKILGTVTRQSPSCWQPELRPDLAVKSLTVSAAPKHPNRDLYRVVIANHGVTAVGPFQVEIAFATSTTPSFRTFPGLGAHSLLSFSFAGPLCTTANAPTVTVDPSLSIDDYNLSNNRLIATCPAS